MNSQFRIHPNLATSTAGPMVNNQPIHLRQSDIDGACGPHCTLMALMLFGVVERQDLDTLPKPRQKRLDALWKKTTPNYFKGTYPRQLQATLESYNQEIESKLLRRNVLPGTLATLDKNGLCLAAIRTSPTSSHWVLVVGSGGHDKNGVYVAHCLLILDPGHPPISLAGWNAMLWLKPDRHKQYGYDTPSGRIKVQLQNMVSMNRRCNHGSK